MYGRVTNEMIEWIDRYEDTILLVSMIAQTMVVVIHIYLKMYDHVSY